MILAILGILCAGNAFFAGHAFAQEGKFQATVFLIGVKPFVVPDFTINGESFYDAVRQGKHVKLPFRDLKEIKFLNPGKNYETEVMFNDGRRETYRLQPASDITVISEMSSVEYSHIKVARIMLSPMPAQPPPSDTRPVVQQPRPDATQ